MNTTIHVLFPCWTRFKLTIGICVWVYYDRSYNSFENYNLCSFTYCCCSVYNCISNIHLRFILESSETVLNPERTSMFEIRFNGSLWKYNFAVFKILVASHLFFWTLGRRQILSDWKLNLYHSRHFCYIIRVFKSEQEFI